MNTKSCIKKICIAIDKSSNDFNLIEFASQFPREAVLKIGLEYFTKFGALNLDKLEHDIFLDLKFHDIPNTVYHAVKNACEIPNVKFLTIHASGEREMIQAAVEARNQQKSDTKIICVTKLTSQVATIEDVLFFTKIAMESGADGIVCSAMEVRFVREEFGQSPIMIITPGIRPNWYSTEDDQVRICTPKQAFADGSSMIVIGRPITQSDNPRKAYDVVAREIES